VRQGRWDQGDKLFAIAALSDGTRNALLYISYSVNPTLTHPYFNASPESTRAHGHPRIPSRGT
jgi:hypothetical protein